MIDARVADDLRQMAEGLLYQSKDWPAMDDEATPLAAVNECVAILMDASSVTTPRIDQTVM